MATCPSCSLIIRVIFDEVSIGGARQRYLPRLTSRARRYTQMDFEDYAEEDQQSNMPEKIDTASAAVAVAA